ncbi:Protein CBG26334 [Caenorhabditis briggsae]|nr:Protein CBG26334 [Caenorhabditis briggsae]CAR98936.1 Protein CBG26334 [Caenorhabditis briggsae]
MHHVEE